jgi:serine/threonine protein kinase
MAPALGARGLPVASMRPQVGQVINNKYRLLRLVGDGGMGSVYEARHEVLGTTVALKFLHPELSRRPGLVQRFLQEARVSAQIRSDHVVRVTDVDQTQNGLAFLVMEFVEGRTLQTLYEELYRAGQRLMYRDALGYAVQMLEGVEHAHAAGIVHRDLKPDNVIIAKGSKGEPLLKLLDFGIAKLKVSGELQKGLTRPGVIMGTPEYMAPEQAFSADQVDHRADVFSLGVMIFEMLAGRRPVGGDDPQAIASAYLQGRVAKLRDLAPHVPEALAAAVHKAMAAQPHERFANAGELRGAIEPFLLELVGPTPSPGRPSMAQIQASPQAGTAATEASPVPAITPEGERRVPKTLPPEDEPSHAEGGRGSLVATSPSHPPALAGDLAPTADMPPLEALAGAARPAGTALGPMHAEPAVHLPSLQPAVAPRRKAKRGMPIGVILLASAAVAGAVVAVVVLVNRSGRSSGAAQPTAQPIPTQVIANQVPPTPPPTLPGPQHQPPGPQPTATTPPQKQPTKPGFPTNPPVLPSMPPLMLPSQLPPLPFPIPGMGPTEPPPSQPQQPPPTQPTSPGPVVIPVPGN